MLCPLKFARYEFEGGETCIGAECGFFGGVCDMDMSLSVQKRPNDELQEGDAVSILRRAADSDTPMVRLCDRFDAAPLLPSEHSRVFGQLADMVERDYVRREHYYERVKELGAERDEQIAELRAENNALRAMRATIDRLQTTVDELYKSCDILRDKNRSLKAHISKMQQGRHGWHVKGVELQRQVDELTAQLRASNAERERLRECLGIATDNAHDLLTLVDESGNVYDRDEGLA